MLQPKFIKKYYPFLEETGIIVPVYINQHQVLVKALYLRPEIFGTVPMYFLTTNIEENDHLARSITDHLYDSNHETRIVQNIVLGRCSMCHSREPGYDGIHRAPKNVLLETSKDIAMAARDIYLQAGVTTAMPPANLSWMEPQERLAIQRWYRAAARQLPLSLASN